METISPPLTPIRQSMSPLNTSPTNSYREQLRRRHSSFSSNHDRSPVSPRKNRFSNASQYSNDFSPDGGGGEGGGVDGMGNLADELDQLEEDMDVGEDTTEVTGDSFTEQEKEPSPVDGARDSGIDVSYSSKKNSPRARRNFSKPFNNKEEPPDETDEDEQQDILSPELEDAMNNIARMTSHTSTATATAEDPLIPRTIALLQDLGNQSNLETGIQRFTTSTNSMTSNLAAQGKAIQSLSTTFYSPFTFSAPLDSVTLEETTPLVESLLEHLPLPDPAPLQGMQKLDRETNNIIQFLSQLTDALQIGKQTTNTASRHLRTTQTIVSELRRERERAETAREELSKTNWNEKLRERWCASECKDILGGFERRCDSLRQGLVEHATAAGASV